jgi:hypothetical protein
MERSSKGIFDFLCLQMEKLDKKLINVEVLKGHAASAKQLNNLLKHELDRSRLIAKIPNIKIREIEDFVVSKN